LDELGFIALALWIETFPHPLTPSGPFSDVDDT